MPALIAAARARDRRRAGGDGVTGVNIPLLRKAVEWAEAEAMKPPELCEWNQVDLKVERKEFELAGLEAKAKECGTCFCIAGYVIEITDPSLWETASRYCDEASRLLGIPGRGGHELFFSMNTIQDVRRIAEDLAGERL